MRSRAARSCNSVIMTYGQFRWIEKGPIFEGWSSIHQARFYIYNSHDKLKKEKHHDFHGMIVVIPCFDPSQPHMACVSQATAFHAGRVDVHQSDLRIRRRELLGGPLRIHLRCGLHGWLLALLPCGSRRLNCYRSCGANPKLYHRSVSVPELDYGNIGSYHPWMRDG